MYKVRYANYDLIKYDLYGNLRRHKISPLSLLSNRGPRTHCMHVSNSYISPINRSIIFTSRTGSSSAAAATVAHFSDDRGWIQTRMVNGTRLRFLSLSLSFTLCYLPFENMVFGFSRTSPCAHLLFLKLKLSIGRSSLLLFLFYLYLILTWPHTPARIPINKKNMPGRPQRNGSSFTRSPSSRLLEAPVTRNACVRAREPRSPPPRVHLYFIYPCTINLRLAPR